METGITIFTPTYNRAHLLNRLFESIKNLSYENFEWLIVDDGSTDETEKLINRFREKSKFKIIYVKQENQGKYMAINNGVKLANKELFFIVDSDDWLPNDSLNRIDEYYKKIKSNEGFAGVAGLKKVMNKNAESISLHENEFITNSLDFRFTYNYSGDVAEVYRTSVLKDYPFPEFKNEKFCTESLVGNRIAQKYNLLFFNQFIYDCEYHEEGLSANYNQLMMKNPKSSLLYYKELLSSWKYDDNELKLKFIKRFINIARNNRYSWFYIIRNLKLGDLIFYFRS